MRVSNPVFSISVVLIVLFLAGCGEEADPLGTDPPEPQIGHFVHSADTVILDDATMDLLSGYDEDGTFIFSQSTAELDSLKPGNVLLGEPVDTAPNGFLRIVESIEGEKGTITITTRQGSLQDAFDELKVHFEKRLTMADLDGEPKFIEGVKLLRDGAKDEGFYISLNNRFFSHGITAEGSLELNPTFSLDIDFSIFSGVETIKYRNDVEVIASLTFHVPGPTTSFGHEIELGTMTMVPIFVYGITVVPELSVRLGATISAGVSAHPTVTQTVNIINEFVYEDGVWNNPYEYTTNFEYEGLNPSLEVSIEGYVGPRLDLKLWKISGPFMTTFAFLNYKVEPMVPIWWTLSAGVRVGGGITMRNIYFDIEDYVVPVTFNYSRTLVQADTVSLVPDFTSDITEGYAPLSVQFWDLTTPPDSVQTWFWSFDQGEIQFHIDQNPVFVFEQPGIYDVSLTASRLWGSNFNITKPAYIVVHWAIFCADFSADQTVGDAPFTVQFQDFSDPAGLITNWEWNFGDGSTSSLANPSHTYTNPGNYTVSLAVSDSDTTAMETRTNFITVNTPAAALTADFIANQTSGPAPLSVMFIDTSTPAENITSRLWSFGDGGTSTLLTPFHTYDTPGEYTVSLTVSDGNQEATEVKTSFISVIEENNNYDSFCEVSVNGVPWEATTVFASQVMGFSLNATKQENDDPFGDRVYELILNLGSYSGVGAYTLEEIHTYDYGLLSTDFSNNQSETSYISHHDSPGSAVITVHEQVVMPNGSTKTHVVGTLNFVGQDTQDDENTIPVSAVFEVYYTVY